MNVEPPSFNGMAFKAEVFGYTAVPYRIGGAPLRIMEIRCKGRGRNFHYNERHAFWRNFAEMDVTDENQVLHFIRHRGDPFGRLSGGGETTTFGWLDLIDHLKPLADAWDAGSDGAPSRVSANETKVQRALQQATDWPELGFLLSPKIYVDRDRGGFRYKLEASSLAGYMMATAMMQAQDRAPMMRCQHCDSWFALATRHAKFCSPSCRALASTANGKSDE